VRRLAIVLAACGGGTPAAPPPPRTTSAPVDAGPTAEQLAAQEQAKHDEIVAAHRKLEAEEQEALAATCSDPKGNHQRCEPSCYAAEAADPRAGKKVRGAVEIQHTVCQRGDTYLILDELDKLAVREGRASKPHKKGTWQGDVEVALAADGVVVTGSKWRDVTHPLTNEKLRCVAASHFAKISHPLDACGGTGDVVCEAAGNAAAHGLDVVHYRLAEAKRLASSDQAGCQKAALEAIAVAHGLPRWRQYAKVNIDKWPKNARFRTRFDGTLDEDTLFATAATLGSDAESVYASCGGTSPKTTPEQEQSFHVCW
jgi:hypothetical protein